MCGFILNKINTTMPKINTNGFCNPEQDFEIIIKRPDSAEKSFRPKFNES
jgi:hypothetical protein